ncbi:hypothetical protein JCM11641_004783 [Rhodosporidiobolus odoratus]
MTLTLLTAPPQALTAEELANLSSSTPSTFEGIAPITRHHEHELRVKVDPAYEGFTGDDLEGELWITEGALSFYSSAASTGLSIPYTHVTLHAISRTSAPSTTATADAPAQPCIYIQFEETENAEETDDYDGSGSREMWLTPKDAESIEKIFSTLSYCASLHPTTSSSAPGVLSGGVNGNGESDSHFNDPSAALFASMGLDPDSMVYAGADGEVAGPGLAALQCENGTDGQWEDVEAEQEQPETGRQRSDFVNPGRARGAPY